MCVCHEISVKQPHYDAATHQSKQKQLWWKESWKQNLDLVLWLMRLIYCIWRFILQISCCVPKRFLLFIQLLAFQLNFWTIVSVKKRQEPFKPGSQPTLTICAPHFEQRLKKLRVSRRLYSCASSSQHIKGLDEEVQAQSGYYSEDSSIKSSSWQGEQAKSLLTVSVNRSPAFQNSTDRLGLNIIVQETDYIYSWVTTHQERKWSHESLPCAIW